MIETFQQAEIPFTFDADGARLWSYAHMNLMIPWFFVHYESNVEGQIVSCQIMLFNIGQIEQLILDSTISIIAIYLISPGYVNHTNEWSMDMIKSLSTGIDKKSNLEQTVTRYELANSTFYFYPEITTKASFKKIADIYFH